jgi:hypothetical protein
MRLHKEAPSLRPRASKAAHALNRVIDFIGNLYIELTEKHRDEPPLRLTPRRKRPAR